MKPSTSRTLHGLWIVSMIWLGIATVGIIYWFVRWLTDETNPARNEYVIGAGLWLIYSFPAGVAVLIAGILPKSGLSLYQRVGGIVLFLFSITANVVLGLLQASPR